VGYTLALPDYPATDALVTCEFLRSIEKDVDFEIFDITKNETLLVGHLQSPEHEILGNLIEDLKRIIRITKEFNIDLR